MLFRMELCRLVFFIMLSFILCFNYYNTLKKFFGGILVELNSLAEHPLSLYIEEFEKPYLKHTRRYYERESAAVIANASISEYMKKA